MPTTRRQMAKAAAPSGAPETPVKSRATKTTRNDDDSSDEEPETPDASATHIFDGVVYSTYQEMVNAKRKRNEQVLQSLGLLGADGAPGLGLAKKKTATQRGIKKQKTTKEPLPRRKSSRLSTEKANLVALDYYVKDWNRDNKVIHVEQGDADNESAEAETPKFFKGRLNDGDDMAIKDTVEALDNKWIHDDTVDMAETFVKSTLLELSGIKSHIKRPSKRTSPTSVAAMAFEKDVASKVDGLSIDKEEWVAKVTPDRIYSVAAHPSEDKLIACAGDKWGHIGLWNVDAHSTDSGNETHLFRVHSRPICGLHWATADSMISASYDGTVRRLNVETGTFQEIFASYDDSNTYYAEDLGFGVDEGYNFWHQNVTLDHRYPGSNPCLFLATSVGKALHLDLRIDGKQRITFYEKLSERKINTLSLHPNGYTLASAGNDGLVNLWDTRKFQNTRGMGKPAKALATQNIGFSVNSSYFSPDSGTLLSTTMANKLELTDDAHKLTGSFKPTKSIQHNNQTGRWLSTIMAAWHPKQDIFVSGSMKKPRCIEVFDSRGKLLREVTGESLTAVASRCCFHPSTDKLIVLGGNSSGRMVAIR